MNAEVKVISVVSDMDHKQN